MEERDKRGSARRVYRIKQYIPKLGIADDYEAMFEGQSSQPENSGDTLTQICVELEGQSIYVEAGFETDLKIDIKQSRDGWDRSHTNPQTCLKIDIKQFRDDWDMGHTNPQGPSRNNNGSATHEQTQVVTGQGACGHFEATVEVHESSQPENLTTSENSGDPAPIQTCERTPIPENPSGNNNGSDTPEQNHVVTEQGACASKPLESLVHDLSKSVEKIFQRLDTRTEGASHYDYEVIGNHFGHDHFEIKSRFEKSDNGPSRAMIEAIVVRHPELTVEEFASVVEEQTHRNDVACLLRSYDRDSLSKSGDLSLSLE